MAHFDQIWPFLRLRSKCFKKIAKNSGIKGTVPKSDRTPSRRLTLGRVDLHNASL